MANKLMGIPKGDTQNYIFCRYLWMKRLNTQLKEPNNENSIEVLKNVKPTNEKTIL